MRTLSLLAALLLAPSLASAEVPLPSYEKRLGIAAWYRVNEHIDRGRRLQSQQSPQLSPENQAELKREAEAAFRAAIDEAEAFLARFLCSIQPVAQKRDVRVQPLAQLFKRLPDLLVVNL